MRGRCWFEELCDSFRWYGLSKPKILPDGRKKLAKAQRILSRRQEIALNRNNPLAEAKNYQKQKRKVAILHEKISNARMDYLHKVSTEIIKNHDVIGMEDLQVSNMMKDHKLAKAISEVSWSQLKKCWNTKQNGMVNKS